MYRRVFVLVFDVVDAIVVNVSVGVYYKMLLVTYVRKKMHSSSTLTGFVKSYFVLLKTLEETFYYSRSGKSLTTFYILHF